MFDVASGVLTAALATSGTLTVAYPTGRTRGNYVGGLRHRFVTESGGEYVSPTDFELTLNTTASGITLTWRAAATLPIGTAWRLMIDGFGQNAAPVGGPAQLQIAAQRTIEKAGGSVAFPGLLTVINLGSPAVADADGICASQSVSSGVASLLNGALLSGSRMILDVPRNVVAAWTNAAIITVVGKDAYGNTMSEASASGTSFTGAKAFKEITSVTFNANVTGATVGTGVVLGLPVYLPGTGFVLKEILNGAAATAGTLVAGVLTKPTTTTGDVRGTYNPNSAPDGSRNYVLIAALGGIYYDDLAQA